MRQIGSRVLGLATAGCLLAATAALAQDSAPKPAAPTTPPAAATPAAPPAATPPAASPAPVLGSGPVPAPAHNCDVSSELMQVGDSTLPKVADAISVRKKLDVLVVGSGSSGLASPEGASVAYPAKMEAALREQLPGVTVTVTPELQPKKTAEEVVEVLQRLAAERRPDVVIWQTGTIDATKSVHPDDFRGALDDGIGTLKGAGADTILMNLQYSPRLETMVSLSPYLDSMRAAAQQQDVPLFDRYSIMQYWNEHGQFDLSLASRGFTLAKGVHYCLGRTLATFVVDAAKIDRATLKVQN